MVATVVFTVSAYTADDIADAALKIVFKFEGIYTTIIADDNGAVSLGKIGWHGRRALQLLRLIVDANTQQAEEMLGEELYNEILTASDSSWDTRIFTEDEKAIVKELLATQESKTAQDELAVADIKDYIAHGQRIGIKDGKVLVYFADLENQMGSVGAEDVVEIAIEAVGSASKISLDDIYEASMKDETAASSPIRRKQTYSYCYALNFDSDEAEISFKTGEYKIIASSLRVRSEPDVTSATVTNPILNGAIVNVTEVSDEWGKVSYNGQTGWINLLYAEYAEASFMYEEQTSMREEQSDTHDEKPDLNGNGKVDAADARLALRVSAKLETVSDSVKKIADVDSNGKVTAADARIILRIAAKLQ